jgi:hypothetical protein
MAKYTMTYRDKESALDLYFSLCTLTYLHGVMLDYAQGQLTFVRQSYPCNRLWRLIGLWDVEAPAFSRWSAHRWQWSQPYALASHPLPPGRFPVLISVRGWTDCRATVRLEGLGQVMTSGIEPATFRLVA